VTLFASSLAFRFIPFLHVPAKVGVVAAILLQDSGIEGSVEARQPQARQLVEEPDGELRDDDRDVEDRGAPRVHAIRKGKHSTSAYPSRLERIAKIADELRIRSKVTGNQRFAVIAVC
jgi:hypothetical protein